jgi:isocitrate dehydrogenase
MAEKIKMHLPLVEMDGDEMTRVIWAKVKELLLTPFVELHTEYYDLGLLSRERSRDSITTEAAEAIKKYGVGVKCATITPNDERMTEYSLSEMYKSPNGTIRAILDGTVFRAPIPAPGITPYIPSWKRPITIARHAYGDIYRNTEALVPEGSKAELVLTAADGAEQRLPIHTFENSAGISQGVHNTDVSITSFARSCFSYALDTKQNLWFSAKDTISKIYDRRFRDIFEEVFVRE